MIIEPQRNSNVPLDSFNPATCHLLPIGSAECQIVSSLCQVWSSGRSGSVNKWLRGLTLGRDIFITWSALAQWKTCGKHWTVSGTSIGHRISELWDYRKSRRTLNRKTRLPSNVSLLILGKAKAFLAVTKVEIMKMVRTRDGCLRLKCLSIRIYRRDQKSFKIHLLLPALPFLFKGSGWNFLSSLLCGSVALNWLTSFEVSIATVKTESTLTFIS